MAHELYINWILDYSTYSSLQSWMILITGAYDFGDVIDQYATFATPDEEYVSDLANELKSMAIQSWIYN